MMFLNLTLFLLILCYCFHNANAFVIRLLTETLQNNVAGEPITHQRTVWNFDPDVSQKRRGLFHETHGYRAEKFIERIGLGIDGEEERRRREQQARDTGRLNGEHVINFPPELSGRDNYDASDKRGTAQPDSNKTLSNGQLRISDSGMKRLKEICTDGSFLRISVEGGGCSGFQYKFSLDKNLEKDDLQFGEDEAKIVIDNISLEYCAGATLDYHSELIRSGFRIIANPLAEKGCSCGASFSMKIDLDA